MGNFIIHIYFATIKTSPGTFVVVTKIKYMLTLPYAT